MIILTCQLISAGETSGIRISSYTEKIIIHGIDIGFTKYVTIYGSTSKKSYFVPLALDPPNYDLRDFSLFYKKRNNFKKTEDLKSFELSGFSGFHTSSIVKIVLLDSGVNFLCTFKLICKKTILFNSINLSSPYDTDTVRYLVSIPNDLSIKYDSVHFDSLPFHCIRFHNGKDSQYLEIKAKPYHISPGSQVQNCPFFRQIILPADQSSNADQYFNNWYLSSLDSVSALNQFSKDIIDSLLVRKDGKSLIPMCYEFVRNRFKYVDVEVGMGAFIPHDVNTTLTTKQGDCKDLSNLLCAILKYKGYDANIVLAATNHHFCDFDFPSLASGDHMICSVKADSGIILLDPTDLNHVIGKPVQSLQGKTVFITGHSGPSYFRVPVLNPDENNFNIYLNLTNHSNLLEGNFRIVMSGYIGNELRWAALHLKGADLRTVFRNSIQDIFHNQSIEDFTWNVVPDSIVIQGKVKYYNRCYLANKLGYLYLDYIPEIFPDDLHRSKIKGEKLIGTTMHKNLNLIVNFTDPVQNTEFIPLHEKKVPYAFDFSAGKINDHAIRVSYSLEYNKIRIDTGDIDNVNTLIDEFNKKSHETVVLHF